MFFWFINFCNYHWCCQLKDSAESTNKLKKLVDKQILDSYEACDHSLVEHTFHVLFQEHMEMCTVNICSLLLETIQEPDQVAEDLCA